MSKKVERGLFEGRTVAYKRFRDRVYWNKELLEAGLLGLKQKITDVEKLVETFKPIKGIRGPVPKDYKPRVNFKKTGNNDYTLKVDIRTAAFLRKVVDFGKEKREGLKYHLNAILAVDLWGAFETYNTMLFEELFSAKPELVISDEKISIADAVKNRTGLMGFLIERQLGIIGHFSANELIKFTEKKLRFKYTPLQVTKLTGMYLVRNIIAHNTGLVRSSRIPQLPKTIKVAQNELHITDSYLKFMAQTIESCVVRIEKHVVKKFFD